MDQETQPSLQRLVARTRAFADARDWAVFHTPKNLAMALAGEVGELAAVFQWLTDEEAWAAAAGDRRGELEDELADVLLYLVRLADVVGVDLIEVADQKIDRNEERYPVESSRGRATKYTELGD